MLSCCISPEISSVLTATERLDLLRIRRRTTRTMIAATTTRTATTIPMMSPVFFDLFFDDELLLPEFPPMFSLAVSVAFTVYIGVASDEVGTFPDVCELDEDGEDGSNDEVVGAGEGVDGVSSPMHLPSLSSNPSAHLLHPNPSAPHETQP